LGVEGTADVLWTGLLVSLPVLVLTLLVGLAAQPGSSVTQVQEMSLHRFAKAGGRGAWLWWPSA
jgi:flagellar biosynthesis protein FliQ